MMSHRRSRPIGAFLGGFFTGVILLGLALFFTAAGLLRNPERISAMAARFGLVRVVEKTVVRTVSRTIQAIPKQQVAQRQDRINGSIQKLTEAYAQNRLTFDDVEVLSDRVYQAIADQKVTEQEIDQLLDLAEELAR